MEIRQLRYFLKIMECGSFNRAAASLHISQQALSQSINQLEEELDVLLFERTRNGSIPTPAAQAMRLRAGDIVENCVTLMNDVKQDSPSLELLRIYSAEGLYGNPDSSLICTLYHLCRSANAHLEWSEHSGFECITAVAEHRTDMALVCNYEDVAAICGYTIPKTVECLELCRMPALLVTGAQNPLARKEPLEKEDLRDQRFVCVKGIDYRVDFLRRALGTTDFLLRTTSPSRHYPALIDVVEADLGVSISSSLFSQGSKDRALAYRAWPNPEFCWKLAFIWHRDISGHPLLPQVISEISSYYMPYQESLEGYNRPL